MWQNMKLEETYVGRRGNSTFPHRRLLAKPNINILDWNLKQDQLNEINTPRTHDFPPSPFFPSTSSSSTLTVLKSLEFRFILISMAYTTERASAEEPLILDSDTDEFNLSSTHPVKERRWLVQRATPFTMWLVLPWVLFIALSSYLVFTSQIRDRNCRHSIPILYSRLVL